MKLGKNKERIPYKRINSSNRAFEVFKYFKLQKEESDLPNSNLNYTNSLLGNNTESRNGVMLSSMVLEEEFTSDKRIVSNKNLMIEDELKDLKEFISGEFEKMLLVRDESDPIWLINVDMMNDFSSYFPTDNPSNIATKLFNLKKKKVNRFKSA